MHELDMIRDWIDSTNLANIITSWRLGLPLIPSSNINKGIAKLIYLLPNSNMDLVNSII